MNSDAIKQDGNTMTENTPPKMTVELALAALNARPEQPRSRLPRPPSEHPWKFSDEAFNRMLDRAQDDFLDDISQLIGMLCLVAHVYKGKPYTKVEVWEAAIAASERFYDVKHDFLTRTDKDIFFIMADDVIAGTYLKNNEDAATAAPVSMGTPSKAVETLRRRVGAFRQSED